MVGRSKAKYLSENLQNGMVYQLQKADRIETTPHKKGFKDIKVRRNSFFSCKK